ncbi:MAG TPA: class I SAM-dependent methyltransferase, partial [Polyangiaceae bacterium]
VDASAAMLAQLARRVRVRTPNARLELECADVRSWPVRHANYDLVVSHFFFDCFTTQELFSLIARIAPALALDARWLVSDFAIPTHALWNPFARPLIGFLYFAFGLLTGLRLRQLPEYPGAPESAHFQLLKTETALGGALRSEFWERLPQ